MPKENAVIQAAGSEDKDYTVEEPAEREKAKDEKPDKPALVIKKGSKLKRFFNAWWHSKLARWAMLIVLLAAVLSSALYPKSRYFILNNAGVRSTASVTVLDNTAQLPLKNVQVTLAGGNGQTNGDGVVS